MKRRILNLLIALDQFIYVIITLGNGMPDETMSAAAWRLDQKGHWFGKIARPAIDFLFLWDSLTHCKDAAESEKSRTHSARYE